MTRTTARELAVVLSFSVGQGEPPEEAVDRFFEPEHYASLLGEGELFAQAPGGQLDYVKRLVGLVTERRQTLDDYIERYAHGWKPDRISRTAAAILRCAMAEILWIEDVPTASAINEAVELAKKYEPAETVSFLNGVLGGFVRGENLTEPEASPEATEPETKPEAAEA